MAADQEVAAVHADLEAPPVSTAATDPQDAPQLWRGLGLADCVLLVVGSMVGSGIFLTTGQIAGSLPAPWLILAAWLVGGAMALAGALTYAELGAAFPRAGGHYTYLREAYGPLYTASYVMTHSLRRISLGDAQRLNCASTAAITSSRLGK